MRHVFTENRVYIEKISRALLNNMGSTVPLIKEVGEHILLANGKLLRPLLFILSCKLLEYEEEHVYSLSTVFEYIHVASLLHDDVLDNAKIRRSKPSVNNKWGDHIAILEGDFLYSRSLRVALSTQDIRFLEKLAIATENMVEGQLMEIFYSNNLSLTKAQYMDIIEKKTASLLSAACECAAIIAKAGKKKEKALKSFGLNLGMAFQLVDDLLDYVSSEDIFGKPVGKDLKEGKVTLPLIYALQKMGEEDKKRIKRLFEEKKDNSHEHRYIIEKVVQTGAISRTREDAIFFIQKAKESLNVFDNSPAKNALINLSNYIVQRDH